VLVKIKNVKKFKKEIEMSHLRVISISSGNKKIMKNKIEGKK